MNTAQQVDDRRSAILAAAVTVLRRVGFERIRLLDVAREAGVSIGLLQHYFETREQLGREAFAAACGERAHQVAASAGESGTPWERIRRMLDSAFELDGLRERAPTWLELCSAARHDGGLRQEAQRVQDVWRAPLAAAITEGEASGEFHLRVEHDAALDLFLAMIDGMELAVTIAEDRPVPAARARDAALEVARHILGVQGVHRPHADSPRADRRKPRTERKPVS
ncbi:MAG: TetR family transcriptional regulator C-terminal domain-containing protein [Dehalococcoidia bacterium]